MKRITSLTAVLVAPSTVVMSDQAEVALWTSKGGKVEGGRSDGVGTFRVELLVQAWSDDRDKRMHVSQPQCRSQRNNATGPHNELRTSEYRIRVRRWPKGSSGLEGRVRVIGSAKPPNWGQQQVTRMQAVVGSLDAKSEGQH